MLTVCPTPIGNLGDVTERQCEALSGADIIACEDTRRTGKLLERLGIERVDGQPRLWRYDEHTADDQVPNLVEAIKDGQAVVLVSDAGTPTISDPGYRLVRACRQKELEVTALPGAVAASVALSGSGLATDRFVFEGFLPAKDAARVSRLDALRELATTAVAYESPRRVVSTLQAVESVFGDDHQVCVARELTKRHEEYLTGAVGEIRRQLEERNSIRGEVVVIIEGWDPSGDDEERRWAEADRAIEVLADQGLGGRTIKEVVSQLYEVPRSQLYDRIEMLIGDR